MSNYLVSGKLGTGKGKYTVRQMQTHLKKGLRVATNCDLFLEHLLPSQSRMTAVRVPDKPSPLDLDLIGPGCEEADKYDEEKYGIMVLDELGSWLNARSHASADRQAFVDWIIHARKKRWHVYFIAQDLEMIDRQVRQGLVEYLVKVVRGDKIKIPVVGSLLGKLGKLKGLHIANTSMVEMPGYVVERDWFRGNDIHKGYDTLQVFRHWNREPSSPGFRDEVYQGAFSYLSPWHVKGRFDRVLAKKGVLQALFNTRPAAVPALKPKVPEIQRLGNLPPDQAWQAARSYLLQAA
jgi:Zonular occludens toxin (Zot)